MKSFLIPALALAFSAQVVFAETSSAPLVFSFQKQKNPEDLKKSSSTMSEQLSKKLNHKIEVLIPTSYGTTAQGLISNKVHVAYMDSLPFILASKETGLDIIAVEKRNNKTQYDSIFIVKKDSLIKSLKDLKGKKMAFASQTSTSGYLFPFKRLLEEKLLSIPQDLNNFFSHILYAGGYDKAMLAVLNGQADAAAVSDYAFEGAKADLYLTADQRNKLRILTRTPGVPTHLIAVSKVVPEALRAQIQKALLEIANENPDMLSSVYGAAQLVKPQGEHTRGTAEALTQTGLTPSEFVK
ncbi:MAG: phosphate/phosphite/phosphonate ABC transporter substrate-binding protein [Bdellovibrionales bacterium]|nr:phosphate/phosphite/phosphonate ABC transporter substrate-binding protein [Bdellovibrionales bacterium]